MQHVLLLEGGEEPAVLLIHKVNRLDSSVLRKALRQCRCPLLIHAILLQVDAFQDSVTRELRRQVARYKCCDAASGFLAH